MPLGNKSKEELGREFKEHMESLLSLTKVFNIGMRKEFEEIRKAVLTKGCSLEDAVASEETREANLIVSGMIGKSIEKCRSLSKQLGLDVA